MLDLSFENVHVLVSGANGGIGLVTVKLFLQQGANVTAQYNSTAKNLTDDPELQPFLDEKDDSKPKLVLVKCNVTQEDQVKTLFDAGEAAVGQAVNVLVLNHAIYVDEPAPLSKMSLSQFKTTLDVNLTGCFLLIRDFLARLEKPGVPTEVLDETAVVMIGSTAGEFGEANHADYAASKSALTHGLMLSLKNEIVKIAPKGRVNTVAPGWVSTPMAAEAMKNFEIKYQALASTPLKKIATPLDIAYQIVMLASRKVSGHVTGQLIKLHGGMEGRLLNQREDIQ